MAKQLDVVVNLVVKTIEARPGDVLVLESEEPVTNAQFDALREQVAGLRAAGRLPQDVCIFWLDHGLSLRKLPEAERRAMLDTLCASLGMRAVPL